MTYSVNADLRAVARRLTLAHLKKYALPISWADLTIAVEGVEVRAEQVRALRDHQE